MNFIESYLTQLEYLLKILCAHVNNEELYIIVALLMVGLFLSIRLMCSSVILKTFSVKISGEVFSNMSQTPFGIILHLIFDFSTLTCYENQRKKQWVRNQICLSGYRFVFVTDRPGRAMPGTSMWMWSREAKFRKRTGPPHTAGESSD